MAAVVMPARLSGNCAQSQRVSIGPAPLWSSGHTSRRVSLPSTQMTGALYCGQGATPVCALSVSPVIKVHGCGSGKSAALSRCTPTTTTRRSAATSAKEGDLLPRAAIAASLAASTAASGEAARMTSIASAAIETAESGAASPLSPVPDEVASSPVTDSTLTQALGRVGRLLLAAAMSPGTTGGTASDSEPSPDRTVKQATSKCNPCAVGVSAVSDAAETLSTAASDSESVGEGVSQALQRICILDADLTLFVSHQQVYFGTAEEVSQHAALDHLLGTKGSSTIVRDFLGETSRCAAVRDALDHFRKDGASRVVIVSHSHRSVLMRLLELLDIQDLVDDVLGRAEMASRGTPSKTGIALQLGVEAGVAGKGLSVVEDNPSEVADARTKGLSSLRAGSDANPWTGLTEEQLRRLGAGEFD